MHSSKEQPSDLPQPDEQALARSDEVLQQIENACSGSGGTISFAEYMRIALYQPGLGYYSGGLSKFGEQGDFITAPEVSAMFSHCVANQVAEVLSNMGQGSIIEFGAGSGVMAADILLRLDALDCLPEHYYILDVSAELKQRQRETIAERAPNLLELVSWIQTIPEEPMDAVVLANEILDAMPVECFRKLDGEVEQMVIGYERGGLFSDYQPAADELVAAVAAIEQRIEHRLPDYFCSEVNLNTRPWLQTVHDVCRHGVVLLIDYGYPASEYYLAERDKGTLVCHYRHRAHPNPFWHPGLQDITAFVDFTDVAYSASDVGFHVAGFTTQAAFLMSSGIADLHQQQLNDNVIDQVKLAQQVKTLTMPSQMGEKFKVMALAKDYDHDLLGFMLQDHRGKL